jgi:hypothetical protein
MAMLHTVQLNILSLGRQSQRVYALAERPARDLGLASSSVLLTTRRPLAVPIGVAITSSLAGRHAP